MRFAILSLPLFLCACPASSVPPETQLATACNTIAAGYRAAATLRQQGKMSTASIGIVTSLEPTAKTVCDPTHPPVDITAALTAAQTVIDGLAKAGVQ